MKVPKCEIPFRVLIKDPDFKLKFQQVNSQVLLETGCLECWFGYLHLLLKVITARPYYRDIIEGCRLSSLALNCFHKFVLVYAGGAAYDINTEYIIDVLEKDLRQLCLKLAPGCIEPTEDDIKDLTKQILQQISDCINCWHTRGKTGKTPRQVLLIQVNSSDESTDTSDDSGIDEDG